MKKLFFIVSLICLFLIPGKAAAESTKYYGKCSVEVAEESKGLGTVYILDNAGSEPTQVTEITGSADDAMNSGGASWGVSIYTTPAEGYEFANFTDQDGNVYHYPEEAPGTNPNIISLFITSTDEAIPTAYTLFAHFVKAGEGPKTELAEANVTSARKFGTYVAPVETIIPSDFRVYKVLGVKDGHIVVTEITLDGNIPAFTPVLLENVSMFDASISATYDKSELPDPIPEIESGALSGTLEETTAPVGSYILPEQEETLTQFVAVKDEETYVEPYTCWLTVEDSTADAYDIDVTTAVKAIEATDDQTVIHDLQGRRLDTLQEGVNIVNGVKILLKQK